MKAPNWVVSFIAFSKAFFNSYFSTLGWLGKTFVRAMQDLVPFTMVGGFALSAIDVLFFGGVGFVGLGFLYAGLMTFMFATAFTIGVAAVTLFMREAREYKPEIRIFG